MSLTGKTESIAIKGSISNKSTLGGTLGGSDAVHGGVNNPHIIHGKDGISATHEWNGTVLTITSASGTSSADLKGDKGDKGDSAALYRTVSGEGSITIDDVSPISHNVVVTLANKNLLNNHTVNGNETKYGITLTENGDGTYTIKGTARENASFYIHVSSENPLYLKKGVTYTISGGIPDKVGVYVYRQDWEEMYGAASVESKTFTIQDDTQPFGSHIYITKGTTVDGIIKPMLEISDTATEFVPNVDISTSFIAVLDENGEGEIYFPNEEGIINDVKSYSPTMKIQAHPRVFIITATYERDLSKVIADLEERQSEVVQGENGATFTPSVSDEGVISWTNDKGLDNPDPVNIKGQQGKDGSDGKDGTSVTVKNVSESSADGGSNVVTFSDGTTLTVKNGSKGSQGDKGDKGEKGDTGAQGAKGDKGDTGAQGIQGAKGADGKDGSDGRDGKDAISPTVTITSIEGGNRITITDANGSKSADIMDGEDGKSGSDGISPTLSVSKLGKVTTISITDKNGTKTATINDGTDGKDGARGADGTSVTVSSVNESTVDGGSNVVTFSDGKTLTVKNGGKGRDGIDGLDGANGVSPSVSMIPTNEGYEMTIYDAVHGEKFYVIRHGEKGDKGDRGLQGEQGVQGIQGEKGEKGDPGAKGEQGVQGIQGVQGEKGEKGDKGDKGETGKDGADGKTPVKGTDYFTPTDKAEMVNSVISALPKYAGEVVEL
jgi:hypothetical protein